jgi:hypothetical protein
MKCMPAWVREWRYKLKAFLADSPAWAWIEPYDLAKNGRAAYQAWINHYNGQGKLSKRTALAKM